MKTRRSFLKALGLSAVAAPVIASAIMADKPQYVLKPIRNGHPTITFRKSRSAWDLTGNTIKNGDELGRIVWRHDDETDADYKARVWEANK